MISGTHERRESAPSTARFLSAFVFLGFGLLFLLACENPITFVWNLVILTDTTEYTDGDAVVVTLQNESEEAVYIAVCGDAPVYRLQRRRGTVWSPVVASDCTIGQSFSALGRSANATYTLPVTELPDSLNGEATVPASFRFEFFVYQDGDGNRILPEPMRHSNIFVISASTEN
jgi:hypothetical protein